MLNKIDTKYLAILDLTKYYHNTLLNKYHDNINVLKDILTILNKIKKDSF